MNRTARLERVIAVVRQMEALVVEFQGLCGGKWNADKKLAQDPMLGPVKEGISELLGDAVSAWIEDNPAKTLDEVRALPRWAQREALRVFCGHGSEAVDYHEIDVWPHEWAWEILARPISTPEEVRLAHTELFDQFITQQRCKECGGMLEADGNFSWSTPPDHPYYDPVTLPGNKFTCGACNPMPDEGEEVFSEDHIDLDETDQGNDRNPKNRARSAPMSEKPMEKTLNTEKNTVLMHTKVRAAFSQFSADKHVRWQKYEAHFEHGQWWIIATPTEENDRDDEGDVQYSVVDSEPGYGIGFDFERVK